jgi:cytochrome c peroxidase
METEAALKPIVCLSLVLLIAACGRNESRRAERPAGAPVQVAVPLGLPPLPVPEDNPVTAETVALGRKLFYDPRLSGDDSVSCASCHNPQFGFSDGRKVSAGVSGRKGLRNAPTVMNAAFLRPQFWDGRAETLEDQAAGPIANPVEMNQTHDACAAKIGGDPGYAAEFRKAFGPGPVTILKVQKALAAFERTVISGNSPFDRYLYGGDRSALSPPAIRGLAIFRDKTKGNCETCHTIGGSHALFTDGKFHNLGVGVNSEGELTDFGRYEHTKAESDRGAFRTPTLRNIATTAPYMHDGSLKTLRAVVDFYTGGGNSNPWLDRDMHSLNLTGSERDDLVAFLESLTGEMPSDVGPPTTQ